MRTRRHIWLAMALTITTACMLQLGMASSASAATTCKQYKSFPTQSGALKDVRVCAAPAADFPKHSGWGRIVVNFSTSPDPCGFSLFPYDLTEPMPAIGCVAMVPPPIKAWRWTGSAWTAAGLGEGSRAYIAPYAKGWRWAWTQETGWLAIAEQHVAFRWQG